VPNLNGLSLRVGWAIFLGFKLAERGGGLQQSAGLTYGLAICSTQKKIAGIFCSCCRKIRLIVHVILPFVWKYIFVKCSFQIRYNFRISGEYSRTLRGNNFWTAKRKNKAEESHTRDFL
jgi:hypothetical protein